MPVDQADAGGFRARVELSTYEKGLKIADEAMVKYAETFKALAKS